MTLSIMTSSSSMKDSMTYKCQYTRQQCIPVGYVQPTSVAVSGGGSAQGFVCPGVGVSGKGRCLPKVMDPEADLPLHARIDTPCPLHAGIHSPHGQTE